ncbi:NUDIX hydrolase [Actinocrinis puniceicyclus]|uniref:NUDIX hydrolase n=1 Tax=Actinocrinis puniceicyclus TaxID=977794 RepID=A0A8J7WPY6_9ACTN|nr:NUDIX hydrolase [Actinocrinis puniceicyclus]MBS2964685.1 NUDIX hydrolase [Actinocrinis puniceicyclus]
MTFALSDSPEEWPVELTEDLASGGITTYRRDRVRMPSGKAQQREYTLHPGAVAVLALDDDDNVLVITQYRHPVRRRLVELPAGLHDQRGDGEEPLVAAQRELREETDLRAAHWRVLADFYNTAGSSDEASRVYLARDISAADGDPHDREDEEADMGRHWVAFDELLRAVLAGKVGTAATVAGVLALAAVRARPGGLDELRPADAPWDARPF